MKRRNLLHPGIGALGVVAVVLGYTVYHDRQNAGGVEIQLGEGGVSIEQNQAIAALSRRHANHPAEGRTTGANAARRPA